MAIEYRKRDNIMSRITKTQTYAIRWLNHEQKNAEDIASELKLSIKQVQSILEKYGESHGDIKTKQSPVSAVKKMMSSKTSKSQGVTVMTGDASMAIQESNTKSSNRATDRSSYIHSPNG